MLKIICIYIQRNFVKMARNQKGTKWNFVKHSAKYIKIHLGMKLLALFNKNYNISLSYYNLKKYQKGTKWNYVKHFEKQ